MSTPANPAASTGPTPSASQPTAWDLSFVPPLEAALCGGEPPLQFPAGHSGRYRTFRHLLDVSLRVVGQALSATFQATLTCAAGAGDLSGSISATGSLNGYSGTFRFGAQQGQVTITRGQ